MLNKYYFYYIYDDTYLFIYLYLYTYPYFFVDITENAALVLHVQLHPENAGSVTFYVPVILMDVEEEEED